MARTQMLYVQDATTVVGPFRSETEAKAFAAARGGDPIEAKVDADGGTVVTPIPEEWVHEG